MNKELKNFRFDKSREKVCVVIIDKEVAQYMAWTEELKIGPAISQLRNHFHEIGEKG